MQPLLAPATVIDAHIHLFNLRSLPLKAIMRKVPVIRHIAGPLAIILYALTKEFRLNEIDNKFTNKISDNSIIIDEETPKEVLIEWFTLKTMEKLFEQIESKILTKEIDETLRYNEIYVALQDLAESRVFEQSGLNNFSPKVFQGEFVSAVGAFNQEELDGKKSFLKATSSFIGDNLQWALEKLSSNAAQLELEEYLDIDEIPVLNFLALMLSNEAKIYDAAQAGYGNAKVSLLIHYMMDMDASYLKGESYYPFHPTQTDHMMQLVVHSGGKLLGFTAFNPKNKHALESVKQGLAKGNIGVKFYPPMGYLPVGDPDNSVRQNVADFFEFCRQNDTPIFTHCTPQGFQAEKGFGLNCDPDFWKQLLEMPGNSKLRICFGHAGGGDPKIKDHDFHGWYSNEAQWETNDCYARKVVELCQQFENVYCEVGHLQKILKNVDTKLLFKANLIRNFDNENVAYKLKDKICFGTDWHMIKMVDKQEAYYNIFVEIFQDDSLIGSIDKFFSQNFIKFLNIQGYLNSMNENILTDKSMKYLHKLLEKA